MIYKAPKSQKESGRIKKSVLVFKTQKICCGTNFATLGQNHIIDQTRYNLQWNDFYSFWTWSTQKV